MYKNRCQTIALILILLLTLGSKSAWCYLLLILFVVIKTNLIDDDFCDILNKIKQAWNGCYKNKKRDAREEAEQNDRKTREISSLINSDENNIDKKTFITQYLNIESLAINWFYIHRNLQFQNNRKLIYNNSLSICPDGLYQTENKDYVLEVKYSPNAANAVSLLKNGIKQLNKIKDFYVHSNKDNEFYLALIINSEAYLDNLRLKIVNDLYMYDFKIFVFKNENQSLKLLYSIEQKEDT